MKQKRRKFTSSDKAKIALAALKEDLTTNEISQKYNVHKVQISRWKNEARHNLKIIFEQGKRDTDSSAVESDLYETIGRLQHELNFLKKKSGL